MIRAAPGGPFDRERSLLPEIEANLRAAYHLDEPLYQQFGRYLWGLLHFDFGPSFQYRDYTVTELITAGFPVSLTLGADRDRRGGAGRRHGRLASPRYARTQASTTASWPSR